jgi:hypothetical protein
MNLPAIPVHTSIMVVDTVTAVLDKTVREYWAWPFCLSVCTYNVPMLTKFGTQGTVGGEIIFMLC